SHSGASGAESKLPPNVCLRVSTIRWSDCSVQPGEAVHARILCGNTELLYRPAQLSGHPSESPSGTATVARLGIASPSAAPGRHRLPCAAPLPGWTWAHKPLTPVFGCGTITAYGQWPDHCGQTNSPREAQ